MLKTTPLVPLGYLEIHGAIFEFQCHSRAALGLMHQTYRGPTTHPCLARIDVRQCFSIQAYEDHTVMSRSFLVTRRELRPPRINVARTQSPPTHE